MEYTGGPPGRLRSSVPLRLFRATRPGMRPQRRRRRVAGCRRDTSTCDVPARRSTCAAPSRTECPVTSRTACGTRRERRLFYVLRQTLTPFTKSIESNAIALVGHDDQTSSGRCPPCALCRRSFVGVAEGITLEHFKLHEDSGEGGCVEPHPAIPPTDVESHVNASARYGARRAATATP